jgi:hypothetical protein
MTTAAWLMARDLAETRTTGPTAPACSGARRSTCASADQHDRDFIMLRDVVANAGA